MTTNNTPRRVNYTGNGVTTVFSFAFPVASATHVAVYKRSVAGVTTEVTTGYSISLVSGGEDGGSITFTTPPASGETVAIVAETPQTQGTDIPNGGPFFAKTFEDAFDKLQRQIQELQEQADRSLHFSVTNARAGEIPDDDAIKGRVLAFNKDSAAIEAGPLTVDVEAVAGISGEIVSVSQHITEINTIGDDLALGASSVVDTVGTDLLLGEDSEIRGAITAAAASAVSASEALGYRNEAAGYATTALNAKDAAEAAQAASETAQGLSEDARDAAASSQIEIGERSVRYQSQWTSASAGAPTVAATTGATFGEVAGDLYADIGLNETVNVLMPKQGLRILDERAYEIIAEYETVAEGATAPEIDIEWGVYDKDWVLLGTVQAARVTLPVGTRRIDSYRASTPNLSPAESLVLNETDQVYVRPRIHQNKSGFADDGTVRVYALYVVDITERHTGEQITSGEGMVMGATAEAEPFLDDVANVGPALALLGNHMATAETNILSLFDKTPTPYNTVSDAMAAGAALEQSVLIRGTQGGFYYSDPSDLSSVMVIASKSPTAISGNVYTLTAHGMQTGDGVMCATADNGLTQYAKLWVIRHDDDTFSLADSWDAAYQGTARALTGASTAAVFSLLFDPHGAVFLVPNHLRPDGSQGARVRIYEEGKVSAAWFGAMGNAASSASALRQETAALQAGYRFVREWAAKLPVHLGGTNVGLNRGCALVFPSGHYRFLDEISGVIEAANGIALLASANGQVVLTQTDPSKDIINFRGDKTRNTPYYGCGVHGLIFEYEAEDVSVAAGGGGTALTFYHINGAFAAHCEFRGGHRNILCTRVANPAYFDALSFTSGLRQTGGLALWQFDSDSELGDGRVNTTTHAGRIESALGPVPRLITTAIASNVFTAPEAGQSVHNLTTGWALRVFDDFDTLSEDQEVFVRVVTDASFTLHPSRADALAGTNTIAVSDATPGATECRFIRERMRYGQFIKAFDGLFMVSMHCQGCTWATAVAPDDTLANDRIFTLSWQYLYNDNGGLGGVLFTGSASDGFRIVDTQAGECHDTKYGVVVDTTGMFTGASLKFNEMRNIARCGFHYRNSNSRGHKLQVDRWRNINSDDHPDGGEYFIDGDRHVITGDPDFNSSTTKGNVVRAQAGCTNLSIEAPRIAEASRTTKVNILCPDSEIAYRRTKYRKRVEYAVAIGGVVTLAHAAEMVELVAHGAATLSATAVNEGTDELTIAGHGQINGTAFTVPTAAGGLEEVTTYYLRSTGDDTVKVFTTAEGALFDISSAQVALTDSGTPFDLDVPDTQIVNNVVGLDVDDEILLRCRIGTVTVQSAGQFRLNNSRAFTLDSIRDAIGVVLRADGYFVETFRNGFSVPISEQSRTISSSGAIDISAFSTDLNVIHVTLDAEGTDTEDTLTTITGGANGQLLILSPQAGQKITVTSAVNIDPGIARVLEDEGQRLIVKRQADGVWHLVGTLMNDVYFTAKTIDADGDISLEEVPAYITEVFVEISSNDGNPDELDGMAGLLPGQKAHFYKAAASAQVTIKNNQGDMKLNGTDIVLVNTQDAGTLVRRDMSGNVFEYSRSG